MEVYSFQVKGHEVDITLKDGFVAFTFEHDGKGYGQKIKMESEKVADIFAAAALVAVAAIETIDALENKDKTQDASIS